MRREFDPPVATWFVAITIFLIAMNLRAPFGLVAPVMPQILRDTGISATTGGLLTTIPLLCFGIVSRFAPALVSRRSIPTILIISFVVILTGIGLRLLIPLPILFLGTVLIGSGAAMGNVLLPAFIKMWSGPRLPMMSALGSAALQLSTAASSGLTIPIQRALRLTWRQAIAWPAVFTMLATALLFAWQRRPQSAVPMAALTTTADRPLWRHPIAIGVTAYLGLQSLIVFSATAWLPTWFVSQGISAAHAGGIVAIARIVGRPAPSPWAGWSVAACNRAPSSGSPARVWSSA